jgi:lipopolysaccharide export system protein LptA
MRGAPQLRPLLAAFAAAAIAATGFAAANAQPKPARQPPPQEQPSGPRNALQGFTQNRNEPVKITSVSLDVRDRTKVATFSGNVQLVQGDTTLRCKTLVVFYDNAQSNGATVKAATPGPAGTDQIRRIEAMGNVIVTQKDQTATGDKAVYDIKDDTVRLYPAPGGYVAVTQGPNVVRGPSLTVHLDTGISHFEGGVESLFVPSKNGAPAAPAAPAAPPHAAPHAAPRPRSNNPTGLY